MYNAWFRQIFSIQWQNSENGKLTKHTPEKAYFLKSIEYENNKLKIVKVDKKAATWWHWHIESVKTWIVSNIEQIISHLTVPFINNSLNFGYHLPLEFIAIILNTVCLSPLRTLEILSGKTYNFSCHNLTKFMKKCICDPQLKSNRIAGLMMAKQHITELS